MKKLNLIVLLLTLAAGLFLAACQPQTVEVTRVVEGETVTETVVQEVEVTRIVEGETVIETVVEEVPVTRVVVAECNIDPPTEPTEITYLGWSMTLFDKYTSYMDKCNTYEDLGVNIRIIDNASAIEQMSLAFSSGGASPYAIVHQSNSSIQSNVWKGWLMPLDDLVEKYREEYDLDDIDPAMWEGATFNGTIYGVPMGSNAIMLQYRSDLFEKYNLEVPTTYDEIIAACEVLKDEPGIDVPFVINLSAGWAWDIAFREALGSLGGSYFVEGSNEPAFNSPEGVAALNAIQEIIDGCMGQEGLTYSSGALSAGLGNGSVAFVHSWASQGANLLDPDQSEMYDKIAFAPAASVEPGGILAGSAWGDFMAIPANYEGDADLAFRIIMEGGRADHQAEAANTGMVSRTSVLEGENSLPFMAPALETIANGVGPTPKRISQPLLSAALGNWLPFLGTGEMTPEEILQAAEEEYIREATAAGYLD